MFNEECRETAQCECGLTCVVGRCVGTSLKGPDQPELPKDVKVGRDNTQWLERATSFGEYLPRTAPTAALRRISVRQHGWGALDGLGLGLLSGVVAGALVGAIYPVARQTTGGCNETPWVCPPGSAIVGALFGAIPGAIVGTLLGAAIGHRTTLEFDDSPIPPSAPRTE